MKRAYLKEFAVTRELAPPIDIEVGGVLRLRADV